MNEKNKNLGIILGVIAFVGIMILFGYRAWLGGIIYLITAFVAIVTLKAEYMNSSGANIIEFLKQQFLNSGINEKLLVIISVLAPIVEIIAVYRWIIVDTEREVEQIMNSIYY